jgi:hypothetical protein
MSPDSLIEAAAAAVRQWRWDPILVNGKPTRVRTKVFVNFVLDETSPPIDLCTVLGNSAFFDRRTINVSGTVQRVDQLALFRSSHCSGSIVVADDADGLRPLKNEKYAAYEAAIASTPTAVSLRGEFQEDKSPGALGGKRLLLERVLHVDTSTPSR